MPGPFPVCSFVSQPSVTANFTSYKPSYVTDTPSVANSSLSRSGLAMMYDSTGKLTYCPNNLLTYSNNFGNAAWVSAGGGVTVSPCVSDPLGGTGAYTITANGAAAKLQQTVTVPIGANGITSIWMRRRTGTGAVYLNDFVSSQPTNFSSSIAGGWVRINTPSTAATSSSFFFSIYLATSGDAVDVFQAQAEAVTYQTSPSTYNSTNSVAYYGPRADYDPSALTLKGWLVEPTATNYQTYSNTLSNAAWTPQNATLGTATTGPDGTLSLSKIQEDNTTNFHCYYTSAGWSGAGRVFSVYMKAAERSYGWLYISNVSEATAYFNLSNGTVGTVSGSLSPVATITNVGNGIYRCSIYVAGTPSFATAGFGAASANGTNSYLGTTGSGIYAGFAQAEIGAFATSYIPTTSASVTRAAETYTPSLYSAQQVMLSYTDQATGSAYTTVLAPAGTWTGAGWISSLRAYDGLTAYPSASNSSVARNGLATMYDANGRLTYAPNNTITYSNAFTDASWFKTNSPLLTYGVSDPFGGTDATIFTAGAANSNIFKFGNSGLSSPCVNSLWVRRRTGSGTIDLLKPDNTWLSNIAVTGTWTQFSVSGLSNSANGSYVGLRVNTLGDAVDIYAATTSRVTYETSPRPGDQVITTSAVYHGSRLDYDPNTLAFKGLLVEATSTNQNKSSADIAGTGWTAGAGTTIGATTIAPDGTNSAKLYQSVGANGYLYNTMVVGMASPCASSIYVKYGGSGQWFLIRSYGTGGAQLWVDLLNGVTGTSSAYSGTGTVFTPTMTAVGNGWYRITLGTSAGATHNYLQIDSVSGNNSGVQNNGAAYVWGAQSEAGVVATSYIATTTAAVTRAAETYTPSAFAAPRTTELTYIDLATGSTFKAGVAAGGTWTGSGWIKLLRSYDGDNMRAPSWIDASGITGLRMVYDSTGRLTYAPNNLLTYSNTFSNAAWTAAASSTITQNQPDQSGVSNTAWSAIPSAGTSTFYWYQNTPGANTYQFSIVAKANGYNFLWIYVGNGTNALIYFNLSNGTVGTASGSSTNKQGTIQNLGNGYYRCTVYTTAAGSTTTGFGVSSVDGNNTLVANGTSGIIVAYATLSAVTYETTPRTVDQVVTTSAAYYGPRFDYDPATLAAKGLLIEESRTNYAYQSQTFNTTWVASNTSVASASQALPTGVSGGWQLTATSTTMAQIYQNLAGYAPAAGQTTDSWIVKAGTSSWVSVSVFDGASRKENYFNVTTGVVGTLSAGCTAAIVNLGNGWYRISISRSTAASPNYAALLVVDGDNSTNVTSGKYVYLFSAQVEAGAFPTSYIPTTTATVTRVADIPKLAGQALSVMQGSAWSLVIETSGFGSAITGSGGGAIMGATAGGTNIAAYADMVGNVAKSYAANVSLSAGASINWGNTNRVATGVSAAGRSLVINGGTVATDANPVSMGVNPIALGSYGAGLNYINGYIRMMSISGARLSDTMLQIKSKVGASL